MTDAPAAGLKWSLISAGSLHSTLKNQTTGFYKTGSSYFYEWLITTMPDNFRGVVIIHTNTLTASSDVTEAASVDQFSINPGEIELPESGGGGGGAPTVTGTATAGGDSTITLEVGSSAINDTYVGSFVYLHAGTGIYQTRRIVSYVGSTRVATVDRDWVTNPISGTEYTLIPSQDSFYGFTDEVGVNQDTGGADNLRLTDGVGAGIDNADVRAYLKTDYNRGRITSSYIKDQTRTGPVDKADGGGPISGRIPNPMYLKSGITYVITFHKANVVQTAPVEITIP